MNINPYGNHLDRELARFIERSGAITNIKATDRESFGAISARAHHSLFGVSNAVKVALVSVKIALTGIKWPVSTQKACRQAWSS